MKKIYVLLMVFSIYMSHSVFADEVTFRFTGTVTSTDANSVAISEVEPGDAVTGKFRFEIDAMDEMPADIHSGLYEAVSLSVLVNGFSYSAADNSISITNDAVLIPGAPALDAYEIVTPLRDVSGPDLSGLPVAQIDLVLVDTDASVFTDDSLPSDLSIDEFEVVSEDPYGTTGGRIVFQSLATGGIGEIRFEIKDVSAAGSPASIYFPHVAAEFPWVTEIGIINTSPAHSFSADLNAFSDAGQLVSSLPISLGPRVRQEIEIAQAFPDSMNIGYLILETDSDAVYGYTKFFTESVSRVAVPAASDINAGDIFISHIASDADWWTGISLLNTTGSAKDLVFQFNNGTELTRTIGPGEHQAFTIRTLFGGISRPDIQSAVIRNSAGIVGLKLFGSQEGSGNRYLSGILLSDQTVQRMYYPHIASDGDWWTGIVAYNAADGPAELTITPYQADGTELAPQFVFLSGREKYIGTIEGLSFPASAAWFRIDSPSLLTGFELFGTHDGKQMAGYTGVGIAAAEGIFPKIERNGGWTGLAFVNIENLPQSITLRAFDNSGTEITAETLVLNGYAKTVGLVQDLFPEDISTATYVTYSADGEVVGFQLNGSGDDMLLDALPAGM